MYMFVLQLLALATGITAAAIPASAVASISPVKARSSRWLGNVTSSNTRDGRDLGFQGRAGNCYINTFGDTFQCTNVNPQQGCNFAAIHARNSGGLTLGPHSYVDLNVDAARDVSTTFVPHLSPEQKSWGLGITNVVPTGPDTGVIYYLAANGEDFDCNGGRCMYFQGAGVATVKVSSYCGVTVDRPQLHMWHGNLPGQVTETYFGDHGALLAEDGYLYAYGSIPNSNNNAVGLARVRPGQATDRDAYTYWNGETFQEERIHNPTADVAVFNAGQGTVMWSKFYKKYIYFTSAYFSIYALSSPTPWGPWSQPSEPLFGLDDMPYRYDAIGFSAFYTPAIQPKYSDADGKYVVLWFTYIASSTTNDGQGHQIITAANITFA